MSSREDSPASLFPPQERDEEQKITASSGQRCYELYEKFSQHGSLLKTCAASLVSREDWYSSVCALRWKKLDMKSNRFVFQLAPSVRRTKESEYGLLPTASSRDWKGKRRSLKDGKNTSDTTGTAFGLDLNQAIERLLPTCTTRDWKDTPGMATTGKDGRSRLDQLPRQIGANLGLKLQPGFAAWMMGFPENWTELPFQGGGEKA